jgi:CRP/FNR family transcriptional regulator, cyclic AMP receptor protein
MPKAQPPARDHDALIDALPETLRALARQGLVRHYRKSTILIEEGTQGDMLYVLLKGRVKAYSADARGREIIFGVYGPGEYMGEMSLDGGPRSASVMTLEATSCALITRVALRAHIASHPDFAFELIERVIRRVRVVTENARSLALLDVYGRLVKHLNLQALANGSDARCIAPRPTHIELAGHVGASREMVSRLLKDLELGGYIATDPDRMLLLKTLPASW